MIQEECEESNLSERGKRPVTRWERLQGTHNKAHQKTHWETDN